MKNFQFRDPFWAPRPQRVKILKILFFKLECSKFQRTLVMLVENQISQKNLGLWPHLSPRGVGSVKILKKNFKLQYSKFQRTLVMLVENQISQHNLSLGPHLRPRGPKVSFFFKFSKFQSEWLLRGPCPLVQIMTLKNFPMHFCYR